MLSPGGPYFRLLNTWTRNRCLGPQDIFALLDEESALRGAYKPAKDRKLIGSYALWVRWIFFGGFAAGGSPLQRLFV